MWDFRFMWDMARYLLLLFGLIPWCSDETISGFVSQDVIYQLSELNGTSFSETATIRFPRRGVAQGKGPCNTWRAEQAAPYPWIDIGPIVSTRRACPALEDETDFLQALEQATLADALGDVLILSNDTGLEMVFQAISSSSE